MKYQEYTTTNNCIFNLTYHLVLVTKYRRKALTASMLDAAEVAIRERCEVRGGGLLEFNGEKDHVHALITLPPAEALADFVNATKTTTSRRLRRDFPQLKQLGSALWSRSYFVCSVGGAPLEVIKEYVRSQARPD